MDNRDDHSFQGGQRRPGRRDANGSSQPTGDRPTGSRPTGDRPASSRPSGDRPYKSRPTGDRPMSSRPSGDRPYSSRPTGDRPTSSRPSGDRPYSNRPTGDRPASSRPTGDRPYSSRPTGDRPMSSRPSGDRPYSNRPTGDRPASSRPSGDRPYSSRPAGDRPASSRPSGDRPYSSRPTGDRPTGSRPTGGRPSSGRYSSDRPSSGPGAGRGPGSDRPERPAGEDRRGKPYAERERPTGQYGERSSERRTDRPYTSRPSRSGPSESRPSAESRPPRTYSREQRPQELDRPIDNIIQQPPLVTALPVASVAPVAPTAPAYADIEPGAGLPDRLEGRNPILEAIKAGRTINKLWIAKREERPDPALGRLVAQARDAGAVIMEVDRKALDAMSTTHGHQGVIAQVAAHEYIELEELVRISKAGPAAPFLLILAELQDSYNLGSILRIADAAGVHGIIIPMRRSVGLDAAVAKASAGAIEHVPVARVGNLVHTIIELKKEGFWIAGTDSDGKTDYRAADWQGPLAILIGSEGEGLSPSLKRQCDFQVSIAMKGKVNSLNAAVATGIVTFEAAAHRHAVVGLAGASEKKERPPFDETSESLDDAGTAEGVEGDESGGTDGAAWQDTQNDLEQSGNDNSF